MVGMTFKEMKTKKSVDIAFGNSQDSLYIGII